MYQKCLNAGIRVRKEDVRLILSNLDPQGVKNRRARKLQRRAYFAKGPNYLWHLDSYDKLKPYGICINGCIDGYSRQIIWLNCYVTSSDPRIIGGYFMEAVSSTGGCPLIVRSDRGTENSTVRDLQQYFRRNGQDRFGGGNSFMYGRSTSNQRIEAFWGFLRKECMQFWMDLLKNLMEDGHFDGGFIDKSLILFCFLAFVQVNINF